MEEPTPRPAVYRAYWAFAAERHSIFERRLAGHDGPWTQDPILREHRFCNVFRAADRVSQHLIQEAAYGDRHADVDDLFLRVVLHRLFCKPATWHLLESELDGIDAASFSPDSYAAVLDRAFESGQRLYTGAYILCANRAYGHERKHRNHLALLHAMLSEGVPNRVARAPSLEAVYHELTSWPLIGPFMGYQLAIDLNYSPLISFSENDFTTPGPGAMRGLAKVFVDLGDFSPSEAIFWLVAKQETVKAELDHEPPRLFGRQLHAIDCQNLLCEVDKYCRVAFPALASNRTQIKQRFMPDPQPYPLFFPPEWGINDAVADERKACVNNPAHI